MTIEIHLPSMLRHYCGGAASLTISAPTVRVALEQLKRDHSSLYQSICDETGVVRRHVNLFVNDSYLHDREGLDTALASGDILTIMPSVSGG